MATKKRTTVKDLATEANLDNDEVLLHLWDIGVDRVKGPVNLQKLPDKFL